MRRTSLVEKDFACDLHLLFDIRCGFDLIGVAHLNEHETAQIFNNLTRTANADRRQHRAPYEWFQAHAQDHDP